VLKRSKFSHCAWNLIKSFEEPAMLVPEMTCVVGLSPQIVISTGASIKLDFYIKHDADGENFLQSVINCA